MGRRLRVHDDEERVYFVTNRGFQQRLWFLPTLLVNAILLGTLAWAVRQHTVKLFAFVFMGNHFHLLVQTPQRNLAPFMRDFQSTLSSKLNRLYGRTGTLFHDRYKDEHVLDEHAFKERYAYITNNPSAADLSNDHQDYVGLCSHGMERRGESMVGRWLNRKLLKRLCRAAGLRVGQATGELLKRATEDITLELAVPGWMEGVARHELVEDMEEVVEAGNRQHVERRRKQGKGVLGLAVLAGEVGQMPQNVKFSPQPMCHASSLEGWSCHVAYLKDVWDRFKRASALWRAGQHDVAFPPGTFPPGRLRPVPTS